MRGKTGQNTARNEPVRAASSDWTREKLRSREAVTTAVAAGGAQGLLLLDFFPALSLPFCAAL